MTKIIREDYYFDQPGPQNTDDVIEAVKKRVEATKIKHVIVATHTGETALKFAKALKGKTSVICVTPAPSRKERNREWPSLKNEYRKELERLKVIIVENAPYAMENTVLEYNKWNIPTIDRIVKEVLYRFGAGMKVAVQITFMTVSGGYIEPNQDVIAVGGTGKGADCAIVLKASYPEFLFSEDAKKQLKIREIIAMPRKVTAE